MAGLDRNGFKRKRLADIRSELQDKWRELNGENSRVTQGIMAKIIALMAWALSVLWQLAEHVYNNGFVHKASGKSLDGLVSNRLMRRRPAEIATGEIEITGDEGTEVEAGFIASNGDMEYVTTEAVTIESDGTVLAPVEAEQAGAEGNTPANTVTEIVTPMVGVDSVANPDPISGGRDEETDGELKRRYELSQSAGNSPTTNGIRAAILGVEGAMTATVIENLSLETDTEGRPGRSFEAFVSGGSDEDVAQAIFNRRAAGVEAYGSITVDIEDDSGHIIPISFSRAEEVEIYFNIELDTDNEFPSDGMQQARTAVIQYVGGTDYDGNVYTGLGAGDDMYFTMLIAALHDIPGVNRIATLEVGTDPDNLNPMSDVAINQQQVATTDYEKVTVT
ncbi:baseplate J/gp47 family protein [Salibacterium sp. K-3]